MSLYEDTERPLHKAVKVKPGDSRDDAKKLLREIGSNLRERILQLTKLKGVGTEDCFDIRYAEFRDCSAVFQSSFGPIFPHYIPFPPIFNGNIYSVPLYVVSMPSDFLFCFIGGFS